jgi:hypothetical protein
MKTRAFLLYIVFLFPNFSAAIAFQQNPVWIGPDDSKLPFLSNQEVEEFLHSAKISRVEIIESGITKPRKMRLIHRGIEANAIFRSVDVYKKAWESADGIKVNFRDYYLFECAAYELDQLLGINHIPPVVYREFEEQDFLSSTDWRELEDREGSLQIWIENAMTERKRAHDSQMPPDGSYWGLQFQIMYLFDNLIYNDDRNQGNILIGSDWKLWFIDSTRAFRPYRELKNPQLIYRCEAGIWSRLSTLKNQEIEQRLDPFLSPSEMKTLLVRLDLLKKHIHNLIKIRGKDLVLFEMK